MVRKAFKPEQIIGKLREAEVLLSQGSTVGEASRKLGVTEQTYYRWRREYGGMRVEQARRLKELEKENTRLKRLVADISLDNAILKEALPGETSKPVAEAQDSRSCLPDSCCLREAGLSGTGTGQGHPASPPIDIR